MKAGGLGKEAFLFDLDGTLVDTESLYVSAIISALKEDGASFGAEEMLRLVFGRSWTDIQMDIETRFPHHAFVGLTERVRRHFRRLSSHADIRIPSSIRLLKDLARTYPVAVVSGSTRQEVKDNIEMISVSEQILFYLGAEDYHPGKPHPNCYRLAARKMNRPPERCLVFEDSGAGVLAAKRAGMACVALARPGYPHDDLSAADAILEDLAEFRAGDYGD